MVAFIVLGTSVELGVLLLIAAPVLVGAAFPLLKPLHRRQETERVRNSDLTSLATDIVAGLRILRGIGGERTFGSNYAGQSSWPARPASPRGSGRPPSRLSACSSPACSWCCSCGSAPVR